MADIRSDLFYAVRRLRKTPLLAIVAVVTIALGIGVNTAVFGLVDGVLLKPHVSVSERVVKVSSSERAQPHPAWMISGSFAQADAETRVVGAHIDPAHADRTLALQRLSDTIFTG